MRPPFLAGIDFWNIIYYHYEWKLEEFPDQNFPAGRQIGFIAQDVDQIIPEVVHRDRDGYLSIDYARMTTVLVEAIKELKAENDLLKERIDRLEEKK